MNSRYLFAIALQVLFLLLSGCSTHLVHLDYEGNPEPNKMITSGIGEIVVTDDRGTDDDWLGAIRGGYGNVLKTLRTDVPTNQIVADVYRQAFVEYGYLDEPDGHIRFIASIKKFDCSYYFNREAHAHIAISLVDRKTNEILFNGSYRSDPTEGGAGAGIFGNVDTLRDLAELALNQTVDKSMMDLSFVAILARAGKPIEDDAVDKLRQLKEMYDQGLISDEEYAAEKQETLDSI